jgi:Na+/serine symporter
VNTSRPRGFKGVVPLAVNQLGSTVVSLSTRALMIITIVLLLAVAVAAVLVWWVTRQPPLTPVEVPTRSVAFNRAAIGP